MVTPLQQNVANINALEEIVFTRPICASNPHAFDCDNVSVMA